MAMEWASPQAVEDATERWSDEQIACRSYGHAWRGHSVTHRPGVYTVTHRCARCGNARWQLMDERGYPLSPWRMRYEEGYLLHRVGRVGADGRAVLRLATLRGVFITEEAEQDSA